MRRGAWRAPCGVGGDLGPAVSWSSLLQPQPVGRNSPLQGFPLVCPAPLLVLACWDAAWWPCTGFSVRRGTQHPRSHGGIGVVGQHGDGSSVFVRQLLSSATGSWITPRMLGCSLSRGNTEVVPQGSHQAEPFSLTLCCLPGPSGSQAPPRKSPSVLAAPWQRGLAVELSLGCLAGPSSSW